MKKCYIIRGLPGSGKSEFAKQIAEYVFEADQFFENQKGEYNFDPKKLKKAHDDCFSHFSKAVDQGLDNIAVSNTATKEWEFSRYKKYAEDNGYIVFVVIVENRHNGVNKHNVPEETIDRMRERFELDL